MGGRRRRGAYEQDTPARSKYSEIANIASGHCTLLCREHTDAIAQPDNQRYALREQEYAAVRDAGAQGN